MDFVHHPVIGTVRAGRLAWITESEHGLRLTAGWSWIITPIPTHRAQVEGGLEVEIELPELRAGSAKCDLQPGRRLLPLMRLPGGRSAAVWVDYRP